MMNCDRTPHVGENNEEQFVMLPESSSPAPFAPEVPLHECPARCGGRDNRSPNRAVDVSIHFVYDMYCHLALAIFNKK